MRNFVSGAGTARRVSRPYKDGVDGLAGALLNQQLQGETDKESGHVHLFCAASDMPTGEGSRTESPAIPMWAGVPGSQRTRFCQIA